MVQVDSMIAVDLMDDLPSIQYKMPEQKQHHLSPYFACIIFGLLKHT